MTLQEAKEQVAKKRSLKGWPDYDKVPYSKWFMIESMLDEAATLYARSKCEEACEEQKRKCAEFIDYNSPITVREMILMCPNTEFKP